jgi:hypothetical protein
MTMLLQPGTELGSLLWKLRQLVKPYPSHGPYYNSLYSYNTPYGLVHDHRG